MRAGLLNEIINILQPVTEKSETGTETTSYEVKYVCRARVTYNGGDRENENGDIFYSHHVTFEVRRFYDIDERDRIRWDGDDYRILCIERNRHDQSIKIVADKINE